MHRLFPGTGVNVYTYLMGAIIPAILPASREDLDRKLVRLRGITDEVQIDIVDGRFVTPATWPYEHGQSSLAEDDTLPELTPFRFDVDLLVEEPEKVIGRWVRAGASRITVHAETTRQLANVVRDFSLTYGHDKSFAPGLLSFGLAVNVTTNVSLIEPYLDQCDYVQFMGIDRIGKQAEPFDERVLQKISAFHRQHPEVLIQVDGGVSHSTMPRLLDAGASRFVIGSAFWKARDLNEAMREFSEITFTRGLYT